MAVAGRYWFAVPLTEDQVPVCSISPPVEEEMQRLNRLGAHWDVPLFSTFPEDFDQTSPEIHVINRQSDELFLADHSVPKDH